MPTVYTTGPPGSTIPTDPAVSPERTKPKVNFNSLNKRYGRVIAERDLGWMCAYCYRLLDPVVRYQDDGYGRLRAIQHPAMPCVDHVVPESRGGPHHIDNFVLSCKSCNSRKGNKLPGEA